MFFCETDMNSSGKFFLVRHLEKCWESWLPEMASMTFPGIFALSVVNSVFL